MIVAYALGAPLCIIHARGGELHMLKEKAQMSTEWDKLSSFATVKAIQYKLLERCDEQMHRHKAGNQSDET